MAQTPITTAGPTITVSTSSELMAAYRLLSNQPGGGEILVDPGSYGRLSLYEFGMTDGTEPVIIASADPENPAHFTEINLRTCVNVRIESVHVDSTGVERDGWVTDLNVQDADTIQIVDSTFIHDEGDALKATGQAVENLGGFRQSSNVLFDGNYVDGYFLGLDIMDTVNFEVTNNEITNLQSDGIRGGGMQDGLISGNYIHDIYPISQSITHSDLIQIWGINAQILTQNVTITDNVLMNSDAATQGIFIRSGELGKDSSATSGYFQDITISNNLIYSSHIHGITVDDVDGLVIDGNTVLWNPEAMMSFDSGDPINYQPIIYTRGSLDVMVTDNIAANIKGENLVLSPQDGNQIVSYGNPADTSYAGHHFVNPFAGAAVTPDDLAVLPTSPWYGTVGSTIGNMPEDFSDGVTAVITPLSGADQYEVTYSAASSFDAAGGPLTDPGYSFHWSFADGTTAEGLSVFKSYEDGGFKGVDLEIRLNGETAADITRNFAIQTKDVFEFDFENGVVDLSEGNPEVINRGETVSDGDTAFLIGDGKKLELGRDTQGLFEMDSFGLALDIELTGDEKSGIFLHLYQTIEGRITKDGTVEVKLTTDQGTYELASGAPIFDDGEAHRIGIAFDGSTGQLELFADTESVASTEAWGSTPPAKYWNLVFGNTWGDSVDAKIDNIIMNHDPSVAGNLPEIAPRPAPPPAEDPVIVDEAPPVEDEPVVVNAPPPAEDPVVVDEASSPAEEPVVVEAAPAGGGSTVVKEAPPEDDPATQDDPADQEDTNPGRGRSGAVKEDKEDGSFFKKLLGILFKLFGGDDDGAPTAEASTDSATEASDDVMLGDVVPITGELDDSRPGDDLDDDDVDLAA